MRLREFTKERLGLNRFRPRALLPYALAALSGFLYFLAFPPLQWSPFGWVALVPLLVAVRRAGSWRSAALCGVTAAIVMSAFGLAWIADMAHRFWNAPWPLAALLLLLYSTFGEINFTLFALASRLLHARLAAWPAAATGALFAVIELLTPKVFPDALGYTQIDTPGLPAASALVGTRGLSFVLAWFAACLAWYPVRDRVSRSRRRIELLVCVVFAVALALYGAQRRRQVDAQASERQLEVVIVQNNVGDAGVFLDDAGDARGMADAVVARNVALTQEALRDGAADLFLWPETSVPVSPRDPAFEPVRALSRALGAPLILGGYDFQQTPTRGWRIFNALYWLDSDGLIRGRYYKSKLLPLGEYIPFSEQFPVLMDWIPNAGRFSPGPGPRSLRVGELSITPFICYEVLFPGYVRRGIDQGGDLLVNLTNDFWFGRYAEPEQHLALARMRAYETARPIVRATNTGISAVIDRNARVLARTGLWQAEILRATLDVPSAPTTPYLRWGEWLFLALLVVAWATTAILWKLVR
jgi:apolipoprotein N-acyltransferase